MDLKKLQADIKELVERINNDHGYDRPEVISYMKVVEEIGEVTNVLLRNQIKSRKGEKLPKEQVKDEIGKEIADSVIALISLANDFDVDLDEVIKKKMEVHNLRY